MNDALDEAFVEGLVVEEDPGVLELFVEAVLELLDGSRGVVDLAVADEHDHDGIRALARWGLVGELEPGAAATTACVRKDRGRVVA